MICPFNCENKEDNKFFDTATEHLIIVMDVKGHVHCHGPFANEYVIRKFADAIVTEMRKHNIDYISVAKQDKE